MALEFLHKAVEEIVLDIICRNGELYLSNLGSELKDALGHCPKSLLDRTICFEGEESNENLPRTLLPFIRNVPFLDESDDIVTLTRSDDGKNAVSTAWKRGEEHGVVKYRIALLIEACRRILLSETRLNPNDKGHDGNTLLHLVAGLPSNSYFYDLQSEQYLKLLLQNGADPRVKNNDDLTPLHLVSGRMKFAIDSGYSVRDEARMSPAMWPSDSRCKQLKVLTSEELFSEADFVLCMKSRGRHGNNILHEWVFAMTEDIQDELEIGSLILSLGVPPGVCNDMGCTPIHYARDAEVFNFLISKGNNIHGHCNDDGDTPFLSVIKNGIIKGTNRGKLLQQPTGPGDSRSPIEQIVAMLSTQNHNLLARDGDGNHVIDVLLESVKQGCYQPNHFSAVCSTLVSLAECCGTELVNEENKLPTTPLERVFDCIESACNHSPPGIGSAKISPLVAVMDALLQNGANPNIAREPNEATLLHRCCQLEALSPDIARNLIFILRFHGANPDMKNKNLKTPREILQRRKNVDHKIMRALVDTQPKTTVRAAFKTKIHETILQELCVSSPRKVDCYRYDPARPIGEGAMGIVFPAIDEKGKRAVALKRIQKNHQDKGVATEIEALCKLSSYEQVVDYYTIVDSEPDFHFIVLELMEGDLADLIQQRKQELAGNPTIVARLVGDMVEGLKYLHSQPGGGILHCDLKPGNVLYTDVPRLRLKIADFSLAKDLTGYSTRTTTSGHSLTGTRGWMAPELVSRKSTRHTKEADVFSLGLVCHFLMSRGKHPFDRSRAVLKKQAVSMRRVLPHELEQSIIDDISYMDEKELTPAGHHLLRQTLAIEPNDRPNVASIGGHCFFWNIPKSIQFLMAVGDQKELAQADKYRDERVILNLEATQLGRRLKDFPWDKEIPELYNEMMSTWKRKGYTATSLVELVRFFRNAYAHEEERSSARKAELMANIFFVKFPDLLLTVLGVVLQVGWDKAPNTGDRQRIKRALSRVN